uniref:RZZ complex subunit KNTC1/ROD C-terminal domain-containing protein n=1 Tax=Ciona intestinalis TaxID=7719 RepID=H2XSU6_CIOIN
ISAYDYDKIEFMLNLIKLNFTSADQVLDVQKGLNLLNYLLHIKRENNPTDLEKQQFWKRGSVSSKSLPSISSTRLPLHALLYGDTNHAWKVISAEVTKKSVDLLVPVAKLLKLNVDKLYMTAAENMITELLVGQIEFFYQHCNCSLNNDDLNSVEMTMIRSLVENISSCQMCVAMARRVSELIPSGAEKVESYKWCLSLLSEWKKSIPEDSSDMSSVDSVFQSINQDFRTSNIEHLLALEKLNTADVLLLVNQPANLIIHLYQHPSIIQRFYAPGDAYPDIHGVVDQVAELYDQDVARLRLTMTLKLLLTVEKKHDQDQEEDNENKEEKTLIQLLYLLTYGNPLTQAQRDLDVFFMSMTETRALVTTNHRKVTNITKLRVLNCLFHIVDDDVIYNLTDKRADHLRDELQLFVYLSKLDAANFKISISHLREADKLSVVHSILSSATHRHNPDTLKVAAEMCQEFGPAPQDTWAVILQQLVALQEVSYLHQLLPNIFHIPAVSTLPCLTSVWQTCVTLPLVALTPPLDEQQNEFVVSCYHFLVLSPLLHRMNLAYVAQQFESLQLYALALGCLLASPASHDRARKLVELKGTEIEAQMEKFCGGKSPIIGHMLLSTFLSANKKT